MTGYRALPLPRAVGTHLQTLGPQERRGAARGAHKAPQTIFQQIKVVASPPRHLLGAAPPPSPPATALPRQGR